jgi:hypothetical protein
MVMKISRKVLECACPLALTQWLPPPHLKPVLEAAGAIALSGKFDCRGKTVALLCSGASGDVAIFRRALELVK